MVQGCTEKEAVFLAWPQSCCKYQQGSVAQRKAMTNELLLLPFDSWELCVRTEADSLLLSSPICPFMLSLTVKLQTPGVKRLIPCIQCRCSLHAASKENEEAVPCSLLWSPSGTPLLVNVCYPTPGQAKDKEMVGCLASHYALLGISDLNFLSSFHNWAISGYF